MVLLPAHAGLIPDFRTLCVCWQGLVRCCRRSVCDQQRANWWNLRTAGHPPSLFHLVSYPFPHSGQYAHMFNSYDATIDPSYGCTPPFPVEFPYAGGALVPTALYASTYSFLPLVMRSDSVLESSLSQPCR